MGEHKAVEKASPIIYQLKRQRYMDIKLSAALTLLDLPPYYLLQA